MTATINTSGPRDLVPFHPGTRVTADVPATTDWDAPGAGLQTGDRHARDGHTGGAIGTIGLVANGANAAVFTAHTVNRHINRSNSLAKEAPASLKSIGRPNAFRANLLEALDITNKSKQKLTTQNEPLTVFLAGKGTLTDKQIGSSMGRDHKSLMESVAYHTSAASSDESSASSARTSAMFCTDTVDEKGNVTESASSKASSYYSQASSYEASASNHRQQASELKSTANEVSGYLSGDHQRKSVMKESIQRDVGRTSEEIGTLKRAANSYETRVKREPFRETTGMRAGEAIVGVMSLAGMGLEAYQAYKSFSADEDHSTAGYLHAAASVGNGMVLASLYNRSPGLGVAGMVVATIGNIGAQMAD